MNPTAEKTADELIEEFTAALVPRPPEPETLPALRAPQGTPGASPLLQVAELIVNNPSAGLEQIAQSCGLSVQVLHMMQRSAGFKAILAGAKGRYEAARLASLVEPETPGPVFERIPLDTVAELDASEAGEKLNSAIGQVADRVARLLPHEMDVMRIADVGVRLAEMKEKISPKAAAGGNHTQNLVVMPGAVPVDILATARATAIQNAGNRIIDVTPSKEN